MKWMALLLILSACTNTIPIETDESMAEKNTETMKLEAHEVMIRKGADTQVIGLSMVFVEQTPQSVTLRSLETQKEHTFHLGEEKTVQHRTITLTRFKGDFGILNVRKAAKAFERGEQYTLRVGDGGFVNEQYVEVKEINENKVTFEADETGLTFTVQGEQEESGLIYLIKPLHETSVLFEWNVGPDR